MTTSKTSHAETPVNYGSRLHPRSLRDDDYVTKSIDVMAERLTSEVGDGKWFCLYAW